jgi:thiamine transport system ATP-binding protein
MDMITIHQGHYQRDGFQLTMDFTLAQSSVSAILGPSGAGKSTLLNIVAGFDHLQTGQVVLDGVDHTTTPPAAHPVNFVFQDNNSFAHLTARNNVALGVAANLRLSDLQWQSVDAALLNVGLATLADRKPGDMSGGERQRIALARVLVRKKPILLLDEAFAALGPALRHDMLRLVKSIQTERELTVLMVTHQPDDARRIADHVLFVGDSIVQPPQTVDDFFASANPSIQNYLGELQ